MSDKLHGVILSAAAFQAERRISGRTDLWAQRFLAPLVKARLRNDTTVSESTTEATNEALYA